MSKYQAPTSDTDRLAFLTTALAAATGQPSAPATKAPAKTKAAAKPRRATATAASDPGYLNPATVAAVQDFLPQFQPAVAALSALLANRMAQVRAREDARATLDTCLRDFWEVLRRRVHRNEEPASVFTRYGLGADGTNPATNTFDALVALADAAIKGDSDAVKAGYPAMVNPDAAELQADLDAARAVAGNVPQADTAYIKAQGAVAALRPRADELIGDIIGDLRYNLRKLDPPTQRRIMRTYGATFTALPGETPEPPPTPPPATKP